MSVSVVDTVITPVRSQADASDVVRTVTSATSSWARMVYQTVKEEAQEKGLIFPNPELLSLVLEVNSDLWRIWEEVIYGPVVRQYEALCHMLDNSDIVSLLKHLAHHMWSAMVQMQHDLRYRILQEVLAWPKYFQGIAQKLITGKYETFTVSITFSYNLDLNKSDAAVFTIKSVD